MLSAIGPSVQSSTSSMAASTAAIDAQISRYKKELSNCVNCESADTKQGQADILALTNKIKIAEPQLEKASTARTEQHPPSPILHTSDNDQSNLQPNNSITENQASADSSLALDSSTTIRGQYVDVYV